LKSPYQFETTLNSEVGIPTSCTSNFKLGSTIFDALGIRYLGYFLRASTEEIHCGFDYLYVKINSTQVQKINICRTNIPWRLYEINIRAYAGKTVTIQFGGKTDDSLISCWRIDDIYLKWLCIYYISTLQNSFRQANTEPALIYS
jgi:hypothetical protein